jgi:hypothetical protein
MYTPAVWDVLDNLPNGVGRVTHPRHPGMAIQAVARKCWVPQYQYSKIRIEYWLVDYSSGQFLGTLFVQVRDSLYARNLPIRGWRRAR